VKKRAGSLIRGIEDDGVSLTSFQWYFRLESIDQIAGSSTIDFEDDRDIIIKGSNENVWYCGDLSPNV
jgi:hypothetical protein